MARKALCAVLYLLLPFSGHAALQVGKYVEQSDLDMARDADAKASQACAKAQAMTIEDRARARLQLEDASANNVLLDIMKEARTEAEMTTLAQERLPGAMIGAAAPLIMFFVLLLIYVLICCWTACPFCKCLRCCKRQRTIPFVVKLLCLILIGGMVLALVIVSSLSTRGYGRAQEGFDVLNCAAASMVNSTFKGQSSPYFLGLIPVLGIFDSLEGNLAEGSSFINDLRALLLDTKAITDAVTVATANVDLLAAMLADPLNAQPTNTLHECLACSPLATALSQVGSALSSGTAAALSSARVEVDRQLSGSALSSLRSSLTSAAAPLLELKGTIKNSFTPFVSDTLMEQISDQLSANGTVASVFMIGLALLLAAFAMITIFLWMCREKTSSDAGNPSYYRAVHRCACCTWCCSCYYTMLAFFLGGLLTVLAVPLASVCLIMEDVSSNLLDDISGGMGLDLSGESGDMMGTMIDQCLQNSTGNPRLLDLINVVDENGARITMYDMLVTTTQNVITSSFDEIGTVMSSSGLSITGSAEFIQLKNMLGDVAIDTMMLPSASHNFATDPDYQDMFQNSEIGAYIISTASCSSNTVPLNYGLPGEGQSQSGITAFLSTMTGSFTSSTISRSSCADDFVCKAQGALPGQLNSTDAAACAAARRFMSLKHDLRTRTFKCRRFNRDGTPCDARNMAQNGDLTWRDDCVKTDGTLQVETFDCDLAAFTTLVQDYSGILNTVFGRVDVETGSVVTKIQVDLKALLDVNFLNNINTVGNGVTCGFMGSAYQDVVEGLCYGGVWGIKAVASSYTACAVLTLLLLIKMYIVWRLALDNVNSQNTAITHTRVVPA